MSDNKITLEDIQKDNISSTLVYETYTTRNELQYNSIEVIAEGIHTIESRSVRIMYDYDSKENCLHKNVYYRQDGEEINRSTTTFDTTDRIVDKTGQNIESFIHDDFHDCAESELGDMFDAMCH
jgi:hypothetical protein